MNNYLKIIPKEFSIEFQFSHPYTKYDDALEFVLPEHCPVHKRYNSFVRDDWDLIPFNMTRPLLHHTGKYYSRVAQLINKN